MKRLKTLLAALLLCFGVNAQDDTVDFVGYEDTFQYERFLEIVEQSLFQHYKEVWGKERAYEVIDSMGYEDKDRPTYSDSVYIARLKKLDEETVIDIESNPDMIRTLKYFISKEEGLQHYVWEDQNFSSLCMKNIWTNMKFQLS